MLYIRGFQLGIQFQQQSGHVIIVFIYLFRRTSSTFFHITKKRSKAQVIILDTNEIRVCILCDDDYHPPTHTIIIYCYII